MPQTEPSYTGQATVRAERTIKAPVDRVFDVFTNQMQSWWPSNHRLGATERQDVVLEPREGGRWFERGTDGSTCDWGRVLVWEAPSRIVLAWQIGVGFVPEKDSSKASRIEIKFAEDDAEHTTVSLVHTRFERHGEGWETIRDSVAADGGWADIVASLAGEAERSTGAHGKVIAADAIRFERLLPGPIERVWSFLTESTQRGKWLAEGEMDLSQGAPFTLYFFHESLSPTKETIPEKYRQQFEGGCTLDCQITHVDAPHRLSYLWGGTTEVTFELSSRGEKVLLVLTHRRLDAAQMPDVAAGWHTHLGILVDHAHGREPRPFWSEHGRHEAEYTRRLASITT